MFRAADEKSHHRQDIDRRKLDAVSKIAREAQKQFSRGQWFGFAAMPCGLAVGGGFGLFRPRPRCGDCWCSGVGRARRRTSDSNLPRQGKIKSFLPENRRHPKNSFKAAAGLEDRISDSPAKNADTPAFRKRVASSRYSAAVKFVSKARRLRLLMPTGASLISSTVCDGGLTTASPVSPGVSANPAHGD